MWSGKDKFAALGRPATQFPVGGGGGGGGGQCHILSDDRKRCPLERLVLTDQWNSWVTPMQEISYGGQGWLGCVKDEYKRCVQTFYVYTQQVMSSSHSGTVDVSELCLYLWLPFTQCAVS